MVESSFIHKMNWNNDNTMTMWFKNGRVYVAESITANEAKDWLGAKSVSSYFTKKIKPYKPVRCNI